jgi:hypothetical protein
VLRLNREMAASYLADPEIGSFYVFDAIRAALDSPPVEERVRKRYRVVGENKHGRRWQRPITSDLALAERHRGELLSGGHNRWVKIEASVSTIFVSPWTDLPGEEEERG